MIPSSGDPVPVAGKYLSQTKQIVKNVGSFIKNEFVVNPVARLKGTAIGTATILGAAYGARYAATGEAKLPTLRTAAGVGSFVLNPIAATAAFGGSKISDAYKIANQQFHNISDKIKGTTIPTVSTPAIDPQIISLLNGYRTPNTSTTIDFSPASTPVSVTLPASNFSAQVGGGGIGELLPLLLLLGGGAALGGYAIGRKKRKKRKSKKKRGVNKS